jgi:CO/xanthine dehydrogenase FAD-binding subunit
MSAIVLPTSLPEALQLLDEDPTITVLAGGTDLMVGLNYGLHRPHTVLSLRRVGELTGWREEPDGALHLGARLTYRDLQDDPALAARLPALAQAARTVGSPQIRNAGTLGGNLATASPAGDTLPVLAALDATVVVASARATRELALLGGDDPFLVGPKRTALRPGELVTGVRVPAPDGPQEFLKVGPRNAMVISVASTALVVDRTARRVRVSLGSVGPTVLRCTAAEDWLAGHVDWDVAANGDGTGRGAGTAIADPRTYGTFGAMCADAARPITDHRSTADYRRHACAVLARRALLRSL